MVRKGELDIQGGIYHLETGCVEFLGRSPQEAELLASSESLPPSMAVAAVRTAQNEPMEPKSALSLLKAIAGWARGNFSGSGFGWLRVTDLLEMLLICRNLWG